MEFAAGGVSGGSGLRVRGTVRFQHGAAAQTTVGLFCASSRRTE